MQAMSEELHDDDAATCKPEASLADKQRAFSRASTRKLRGGAQVTSHLNALAFGLGCKEQQGDGKAISVVRSLLPPNPTDTELESMKNCVRRAKKLAEIFQHCPALILLRGSNTMLLNVGYKRIERLLRGETVEGCSIPETQRVKLLGQKSESVKLEVKDLFGYSL